MLIVPVKLTGTGICCFEDSGYLEIRKSLWQFHFPSFIALYVSQPFKMFCLTRFISSVKTSPLNSGFVYSDHSNSLLNVSVRHLKLNVAKTKILIAFLSFHLPTFYTSFLNVSFIFLLLKSKAWVFLDCFFPLRPHIQSSANLLPLKHPRNPTTSATLLLPPRSKPLWSLAWIIIIDAQLLSLLSPLPSIHPVVSFWLRSQGDAFEMWIWSCSKPSSVFLCHLR